MPVIVGTAGHVDHGKTSLLTALTGEEKDLDRLGEEKKRGLTINLGFAFLMTPEGNKISFVDVPGHEDFVNTMVIGASGIDIGLLVVASDDSFMPQTVEHLEIMDLLGIKNYITVITKTDITDEETVEIVKEDIDELFKEHPSCTCHAVIQTSAKTGKGIPELKSALFETVHSIESEKTVEGYFRLPVDRIFTMTGFGTVVTGSLVSGSVSVGDRVEIVPEKLTANVRTIEVDDKTTDTAVRGQRTALNLSGIEKEKFKRGSQVVFPGSVESAYMVNTVLSPVASLKDPIKNRIDITFLSGTAKVAGRLELLNASEIKPGESEYIAQIRLREETPVKAGDRFIIRSLSPKVTLAGGYIIEVAKQRVTSSRTAEVERILNLSRADLEQRIEEFFRMSPHRFHTVQEVSFNENIQADKAEEIIKKKISKSLYFENEHILHRDSIALYEDAVFKAVEQFHKDHSGTPGALIREIRNILPQYFNKRIADIVIASLCDEGKLVERDGKYAFPEFSISLSKKEKLLAEEIISFLGQPKVKFAPPTQQELSRQIKTGGGNSFSNTWKFLTQTGKLIQIDKKMFMLKKAVDEMKEIIRKHINKEGEIAIKDFRDHLGNSRKYAVVIMEYFDRIGFTERQGDMRTLKED